MLLLEPVVKPKERPILFQGAMVRALLAGTKTQTRRALTAQPHEETGALTVGNYHPTVVDRHGDEQPGDEVFGVYSSCGEFGLPCPYGQPGDRLWVRETFFAFGRWETRFSAKKGRDEWHFVDMTLECGLVYGFAEELRFAEMRKRAPKGGAGPTWWKRPAIFMPRAACRLVLEVTEVRAERLQAISVADAVAEGIPEEGERCPRCGWSGWVMQGGDPVECEEPAHGRDAAGDYRLLWEQINGSSSWDANPWVWAVSFRRVTP
jgi:hypothetical protein